MDLPRPILTRSLLTRRALPALLLTALAVSACAPEPSSSPSSSGAAPSGSASAGAATSAAAACNPPSLKTLTSGTLTFGTDQPVYEPWFVDDKPESGKGFEGAVAAAVAKQLGYTPATTTWVRAPFNAAVQPGPKTFDVDLNEFSVTDERKQAVDFSSPYYDVTQAVVAIKGTPAASAKSLQALAGLKLGAQVGTTSYSAITDVVKPGKDPAVYNNNDDAKAALTNGQIDALVVDLPTAFYITSAELKNGVIVGQLPAGSGKAEQFGMVLDKGSSLTPCVSKAVDALKSDGTLKALATKWLAESGAAPVLK